jgi:hypothetical protein
VLLQAGLDGDAAGALEDGDIVAGGRGAPGRRAQLAQIVVSLELAADGLAALLLLVVGDVAEN